MRVGSRRIDMNMNQSLEELINCSHTPRCLRRAGIDTVEQLSHLTEDDLLKIKGIGKVISRDIRTKLQDWKGNAALNAAEQIP